MSDFPPPPPPPPGEGLPELPVSTVGPWPRFLAQLLDGLVLFIPNAIILQVFGGGTGTVVAGFVAAFVWFGYSVWFESSKGQTVGKMALGIRVVGPDGGLPTPEVAARRNAWGFVRVIPGYVGAVLAMLAVVLIAVSIATDPRKRGVHDHFAGTTVIRV